MSATTGTLPPPASEGNCPGPMTRAALLALRTGGQLNVNCHYVITDHVQGTLAAGTTVTLHAVSSTELSEEARVNTLFDNEAWFGIYDLDASSIIYLRDNRGNEVDGATQVGQFDWGNTSYSYFKVLEGSSLAVNIGNTAIKQRVTVSGASVLNLTGFTGNISDCEITENAQCSIANTSLTFTGNTVTDSTQVFGSLLTAAGSSVQRCVLRNSSLTLTGAGAVTMFDTDVLSSTVTHNSSGTVLWGTCTFSGGATVQHTGTGSQSLTRVRVLDAGRILHTGAGTLTGLNFDVEDGPNSRLEVSGIGNFTATRGRIDNNGFVLHAGNAAMALTDVVVQIGGRIQTVAGALATLTATSATVSHSANVILQAGSAGAVFIEDAILQRGLIDKRATSTAGTFRFGHIATAAQTTTLDGATIAIIGNANYTIASGFYGRTSTVNFGGDRDVQHIANDIRNTTTINHTGTGGVAGTFLDRIIESRIDRSTVNFTATGAVQNSIEMLEMLSNSTFNIQGTSSGQRCIRWKLAAFSVATFTDVTAAMNHTNTTVWDASTLTYTNSAVAKNIADSSLTGGSVLTIASPTAAGLVQRITAFSQGTVTISGGVGTVSRATASARAVLAFTGGAAHENITASMQSTLTMPFSTSSVYHHTTANTTTTAANTGRGRDFFNNNIV
jgi:hypothetical protein